ncbi:MAG: choice-of-anchor D domain-containing protein [Bacteroidetes bacterium]|nr:choice-of-anchor D domain-containing protein [Bacteroidota bacterium]
MKKFYMLISLWSVCMFFFSFSHAQLSAGDIAFLQYNGDGSGTTIKFLALTDIAHGEVIKFTDDGWQSSGNFRGSEGTVTWTSPGVSCGSVVSFSEGGMALSTSGDQIIAYQGISGSPAMISAIQMNGGWDASANSSNTSAVPTGLTNGANCLAISPEADNAKYNGTLTGTKASIRSAINTPGNWLANNSSAQTFSGIFSISDCASCNISNTGLSAVNCNDNETPANGTDDYIALNLNPIGTGTDANYKVSVSGGTATSISPSSVAFGASTSFALNTGSAGGGNVTITITDAVDGTCSAFVVTTDPGTCVTEPEIQLEQPVSTNQACGFTYDFGQQNESSSSNVTVRIRNSGSDALVFIAPLTVTGSSDYIILAQPVSPIAAGGFSDMIIQFNPTSSGAAISAQIDISSNDSDEATCTVNLTGEGIPPCTAPPGQPVVLTFPTIAVSSISGSFSHATPVSDGYLVVMSTSSSLSVNPVSGTSYSSGNPLGGGTVVQSNATTSFTASGLASLTTYYFFVFAFSESGCYSGPEYLTTSPLNGNVTTLNGPCLSDDFNSGYGNWSESGTYQNSTAGLTGNGTGFNGINDKITTSTTILNPASVDFWLARSPSTAARTLSVEYSGDGSTWTSALDVLVGSVTSSHQLFTASLNLTGNYYMRFMIIQHSVGSYYLDDVTVYCGSPTAEITVEGNGNEITDGDLTPSTSDDTDFGSAEANSESVVKTFTIGNDGAADLSLTLPISITGTNASEFTVTSPPALTVIAPTVSTTFQVTFSPTGLSTRSANISIVNDDTDENPYDFNIEGLGTNSNASDIVADGSFVYASNIDYLVYQDNDITNTTDGSIGAFKFIIRDGGAAGTDGDLEATELTDITFNVTNIDNLRSASLFRGNALISNFESINTGAGTITFSDLSGPNVTAPDEGTNAITLRVSFLAGVKDNEQLQYSIADATANVAGSIFNSSDAGGAVSSNLNNRNRIEVIATKLEFTQQPGDEAINSTMSPAVAVMGLDVFNNPDLDWTGHVSISSDGTMTGDPTTVAAVAGVATFSSIIHTVAGNGFQLTASHPSFSDAFSSLFNITNIVFNNGDYRTTDSGDWQSNQSSPAIWQRLSGGVWTYSNSPNYNTSNTVYIRTGHTISSAGSWANSVNLKILDGGIFNADHPGVTGSIFIYGGGTLNINASMRNNGVFEVQDDGNVVINRRYGNGTENTPVWWNGTEIFHPNSNLIFKDYDCSDDYLIPDNASISTNTFGGYSAVFGNIIVDFDSNLGIGDDWRLLDDGVTINMAHGDLIFRSNQTNGAHMRMAATGTVTSGLGGNFIVEDTYLPTNFISFKTSGSIDFTIQGDLYLESATTRIHAGSSDTSTVNVKGDIHVAQSSVLDFNTAVTANATAIINLEGDLAVANSGLFSNSNDGDFGILNFVGIGDGLTDATTQTIDIASTSSHENEFVLFYVRDDAYVQLINRNLELGEESEFIVDNGGVFDFGFNGSTPLTVGFSDEVEDPDTKFSSLQGSTLKITSPDGISIRGDIGNVRTDPDHRSFDQTATFHYIGKVNQVTGNGLGSSSTGKIIICELETNGTQLSFTNSTGITDFSALSPTGGKLDIRKGRVIESTLAYITGSDGTLYMSPGTHYQIAKGSANAATSSTDHIPRISGGPSNPYILTGGTVELAGNTPGNYFQMLRGSQFRPDYINVKYSGFNVLGGSYKYLSSTTVIDSALIITDDVVVDCINASGLPASFTGDGALVMDNGRLRIKKLGTPNPELSGIATDYAITGGAVEFYGTDATESQLIRGRDSRTTQRTIEYYDIEVNADAANTETFNVNLAAGIIISNVMIVNSPTVFQTEKTDHVAGAGAFYVHPGATYKYGDSYGITLGSSTTLSAGAIRTSSARTSLNFPTSASYGWVSTDDMVTGDALPATIVNAYLERNATSDDVVLTNDLTITGTLDMDRGNLYAETKWLALGSSTTQTGILDYDITHEPFIVGALERWFDSGTNSGYASGLFPLGVENPAIVDDIFNRFTLVEYAAAKSSGGSLAVTFFPVRMGQDGIPIHGIPLKGSCASFDVIQTEEDGYWAYFDRNGISGGTYDITSTGEGFQTINDICQLSLIKRVGGGNWSENGVHQAPYYLDAPGNAQPTVQRTGASGWSNYGFGGGPQNPLSVELISFEAENVNDNSLLTWETASEINNDYFEIMHSLNGVDFNTIGATQGHGTTSAPHDYSFTHLLPPAGINYYRLAVFDFNGNSELSDMRQVRIGRESSFDVVNTLANDVLHINIRDDAQSGVLSIYNMNVQVMLRKHHTGGKGNPVSLDINHLPAAAYVVQWYHGDGVSEQKFVKH